MNEKSIATFCLHDNMLKAVHHQEDPQCQSSLQGRKGDERLRVMITAVGALC